MDKIAWKYVKVEENTLKGHNSIILRLTYLKLAGPHPFMTCNICLKLGFDTLNTCRVTALDGQNCLETCES